MQLATKSSTVRPRPSLPDEWITRLFQELQGNYGSRFLNMWKIGQALPNGQDAGVVNAKRLWAEALSGFAETPTVFRKVLNDLPANPPTLPEFVDLCRKAARGASSNVLQLSHKRTPEENERMRARARALSLHLMRKISGDD